MTIKIVGAILVVVGCGGFGLMVARNHKREVYALQQLIMALEYMENELSYQLTPLPEVCRKITNICSGTIKRFFASLAEEMESQITPDVDRCVIATLQNVRDIPKHAASNIRDMGCSLGRFHLEGQKNAIRSVKDSCRRTLETITKNQEERIRSYQTLALCTGAALAILFI